MSPSTRPLTKVAQTTARIRMGADAANFSEVHERISMNITTTTAIAGPSSRRAYSRRNRLLRVGLAALDPAAGGRAVRGLDAGLTGHRAYSEAALASPPAY